MNESFTSIKCVCWALLVLLQTKMTDFPTLSIHIPQLMKSLLFHIHGA